MKEFWTTGITIKYAIGANNKLIGWNAKCKFYGGNFMGSDSIEGIINNRYLESSMTEAIDHILDTLKTFGIKLCTEIEETKYMGFALYRDEDEKYYTKELLQQIKDEADRRGWKCYIEIE